MIELLFIGIVIFAYYKLAESSGKKNIFVTFIKSMKKGFSKKATVKESSSEDIRLNYNLDIYDDETLEQAYDDLNELESYLDITSDKTSINAINDGIEKLSDAIDEYEQPEESTCSEAHETITLDNHKVILHYKDFQGNISNRVVDVKEYDGAYLSGYCNLRHSSRTFRVDRIIDISDAETGELITDMKAYFIEKYKSSPMFELDKIFNDYFDLLRVLLYVVKADGRYTVKEKAIVRDLLRSFSTNEVSDKQLDKLMSWVEIPTLHAFKMAVGRISKIKNSINYDLVKIAEDIIGTRGSIHPNEAFALEYIKKRMNE